MDSSTVTKKSKVSVTELDRALEEYAYKMLRGEVADTDRSEYERLLAARSGRLVKLPSPSLLGSTRWFKQVG